MKLIWNWIKSNPNRTMFLIPILLVAGISISHVVSWYDIANPLNWAIYLSVAIEVGAMTALVAATNRIKGGVWFMFGIVTIIQMIGNIFYSFKEIDENGELFKSWVELTGPFWDLFSDSTDISAMKRWLALLEGGLLPVISLTSLHFFVKYEKPEDKKEIVVDLITEETVNEPIINIEDENDFDERITELIDVVDNHEPVEYSNKLMEESKIVFENIKKMKEDGRLPIQQENDLEEEPTALANSEYRDSIINIESEEPSDSTEEVQEGSESTGLNRNLGLELNNTWKNIIKKRQNNNIGRIE